MQKFSHSTSRRRIEVAKNASIFPSAHIVLKCAATSLRWNGPLTYVGFEPVTFVARVNVIDSLSQPLTNQLRHEGLPVDKWFWSIGYVLLTFEFSIGLYTNSSWTIMEDAHQLYFCTNVSIFIFPAQPDILDGRTYRLLMRFIRLPTKLSSHHHQFDFSPSILPTTNT